MRFVAILTDAPDTAALRAENSAAHEAYLEANRASVPLSGAMRTDAGAPPRGGLWVIEAESREAAEAIIHADPFFKAGMRASVEIFQWSAVGKIGDAR